MISRTYTIYDHEGRIEGMFKGFDRNFNEKPNTVALVYVDGDVEVFAIDQDPQAIQEFTRYLTIHDQYLNAAYQIFDKVP